MEEDGTFDVLLKRGYKACHEQERLEKFLGGIKDMTEMPDVLFIVDPRKERIAIQEARALGIPISIVDTNCDPMKLII